MAGNPNIPGGTPPEQRPARAGEAKAAATIAEPPLPSSKPLQIFLLVAFVITGAAYVVDQWNEYRISQMQARHPSKLRRLVQGQNAFLAHVHTGDNAFAKKQFDQAVSEYRLALQGRNQAEGHQKLGQALLQQGNPEAAFAQFKEALRLNPRLTEVYSVWGQALIPQGKTDEAVRLFVEALHHNPDSGVIYYNLAVALQDKQRNVEAARRAAVASGRSEEANADAGEARRLATEALQHYTKASRMGMNSPAFWCGFGELLNQQGKFADAETSLTRAVAEDSSLTRAHTELALAQRRQGKFADAIAHYEKALTLTPDDPAILDNLALIYATATNSEVFSPKMAVQLATRACDATTSQNALFMDTLARSYAADGDFLQAISWEDKALHRAWQLGDHDLERELQARYNLFLMHKTE
jgi:tetratricopeptide (TPR) repeat protein